MSSLLGTRTTNRKFVKFFFSFFAVLIVILYAVWRSFDYALGPEITIKFPPDNTATTSSVVAIYGNVERVNNVSLNGRSITIDENGNFNEYMIIFPGINIFSLGASDQFQRMVTKELKIVGI